MANDAMGQMTNVDAPVFLLSAYPYMIFGYQASQVEQISISIRDRDRDVLERGHP